MEVLRKYLKALGISFILVFVLAFLLNILNYFDILNSNVYKAILLLFLVISIFVGSYILGYDSNSKGYLNGIYFGIVISVLFALLSLIFKEELSISSIIYYLIIVFVSSIGGTIGINKKTTEVDAQ